MVGLLRHFVVRRNLGRVFGSSAGYEFASGDTLCPDASVVLHETWASGLPPSAEGVLRVVPDLVVEVLSPSSARRDRGPKRDVYERNGVPEYWLVDWAQREVVVCVLGTDGRYVEAERVCGDDAACSHVLPGFVARLRDMLPQDPG
jgi:Uma2 family endonuclease